MTVQPEIDAALQLHQSGQLEKARAIYERILQHNPKHPDALHLLGVVCHQSGKNDVAVDLISRAIKIDPEQPVFYNSLGSTLNDLHRIDEAIGCYQKAIHLKPDYAEAFCSLARIFRYEGKAREAVGCCEKAIQANPNFVEPHYLMGNLFFDQGMLDQAITCYRKTVRLDPGKAEAYCNMGNAFQARSRYDDAIACYEKAIQLNPGLVEVFANMGSALKEQGRRDDAMACYEKAVALKPNYAEAFNNMGNLFESTGKLGEAAACYRKAADLKPDFAEACANMGNVLKARGDITGAIIHYQKAVELKPDYDKAHSNLIFAMHYDPSVDSGAIFSESLAWWRRYGAPHISSLGVNRFDPNSRALSKRLRIGYVSPDFRQHSVSSFFLPLLMAHDRNQTEIFCYAEVRRPDDMTARIRGLADHWRATVGWGDDAVARQIYEDRIDILVDLAGHTANSRLRVFARKPAPVQVTWLGYPGTTGMPVMDYRLTDDIADPEGEGDKHYSETLVRMADGFLCFSPSDGAPDVSRLPALDSGGVTFGSFNNLPKVNEKVIEVWSRILLQVPGSSLLLKNKSLADEATKRRYMDLFTRNGVAPDRINMLPATASISEHLTLYNRVDIGLDPFPYNGTTTTCEALWMGVPVITLRGNRHASRVGASILTRVGLEELIAVNEDDYVRRAAGLAGDLDRLTELRAGMRQRMMVSPLCDPPSFARAVEGIYRRIWKSWSQERMIG
ncbi:MAG: tetratricopeptide repeat protein [Deltaproteobacteria bacterium]|nr:tetratricopeptide repeat protein [Deltaproteobacteria bacterium]